ncbi:MAG: ABC transporter permease subunit [SAR324 cluster bacterium]|nr:ABC transporter permease subunit [SAR324 cluster bacterium]
MVIDPVLIYRINRFKSFKRGYYSLLILLTLITSSLFLELWINNRALVVHYQGTYYFPIFSGFHSDQQFGGQDEFEVNYRDLTQRFRLNGAENNWLIMPLIPYNPYESDFDSSAGPPPYAPNLANGHILGTDTLGRDIMSRLFYGFRTVIFFSLALYILNTIIGVTMGSMMGYFGGWFDLIMQRIVEIWSNLPVLYIIIIIGSFLVPNVYLLVLIFAILNWTGISWLMRAEIFREKRLQYCQAALSIGASHTRVIFRHLLPNSVVPIIANFPFQMIGGIGALTSLDYLGYGLPVPTPSWGELMKQGQQTFEFAPWIVLSPSVALIVTLLVFAFIGEALRDTLDPKTNSRYY